MGETAPVMIDHPSPNHAPRPPDRPVDLLVLHYTELPLRESLAILTDATRAHRVSAHYVLAEDGGVYRLVDERRTAWHAGRSHWRGHDALNTTSIGIEIVNLHGDRHDYPDRQIDALIVLCHGILARHPGIVARNVVGHSDIAPRRKIDPGVRFPWRRLAEAGVGLWPTADRPAFDGEVGAALRRFGYPPPDPVTGATEADVVAAFQRRFRPLQVDGVDDRETRALIAGLLDRVEHRA